MHRPLIALLFVFAVAPHASHRRETGIWSYGFVVAKGTGQEAADTTEHPFVVTSQVFGYCWSREKKQQLESDASPQVRQLLQSAYGSGVTIAGLRTTVHPTSARAQQDRMQARAGSGRVMDFTLAVVSDRASCVAPRRGATGEQ